MGRIISYAIFGVMLVGALSYMVYDNIRFAGTSSWRSVPGSILESEVTTSSGGRAPEYIRDNEDLIRATRWFFANNMPIASVCHGVEIPARAGCVKGRRMATV